ncbi:hypothetical protein ABLT16_17470 [Pseudomonas aeruginosa]|uniref:hypothetical protein n=1 Tax=Pseudomonas aeruginosa TaxID=287 RepID=UPI0032B57121
MAEKLPLVGFISELGISRSLAGRCGHVSRERTERRTKALYMVPDGHMVVSEGLLRRIAAPVNNQDELDAVHEARIELRALLSEQE